MKNLIQRISKIALPIILAGAGIIGCVTYQPKLDNPKPVEQTIEKLKPVYSKPVYKGIDIGNGYFAESRRAIDNVDLITSAKTGEVILLKVNGKYVSKKTNKYLQTPNWNEVFDKECELIDKNKDKFITEGEVENILDSMTQLQWMGDEGEIISF